MELAQYKLNYYYYYYTPPPPPPPPINALVTPLISA